MEMMVSFIAIPDKSSGAASGKLTRKRVENCVHVVIGKPFLLFMSPAIMDAIRPSNPMRLPMRIADDCLFVTDRGFLFIF